MNNNILILYGSPHKNGNTNKLLNSFLKNLFYDKINIINAYEKSAHPCIDCKNCRKEAKCVFKDLNDFDNFIKSSNILIIASPIYNHSLPSPLKAIIDRMQRYYSEKIFLKTKNNYPPKKAFILLSQGSDENLEKEILSQITPNLKLINTKSIEVFTLKATDKNKNSNFHA
ncbi:MAG: flavodoxin family protein [Clostridia bacterium]|nr:flavodoxin family protein [Clostridia bacterium]